MKMQTRGPSAYTVIACDVPRGNDIECGNFETLDEARGCVEYNHLTDWEIWLGDRIVEESDYVRSNVPYTSTQAADEMPESDFYGEAQ